MKILVLTVGCINYDHDINHYEPIKYLFPNTIRYNYYERIHKIGRDKMNIELLNFVEKERPDYIFYITYQDQIKLNTLLKIKKLGAIIIGWFSDDQWRFDNFSREISPYLDFQITTSSVAFEKYKQLHFHPILCQWGANQRFYVNKNIRRKKYDISFVGQKYGIRGRFIEGLIERGIKISTFGRGWSGHISFNDMIDIFNLSKINLTISASSFNENVKQIKGRHFEVPMCGGFQLTDYVDKLEEYHDLDSEIVCYKNINDAVEKINYYLNNDTAREKVAKAGYRAALNRHTWDNRLKAVFEQVINYDTHYDIYPRPSSLEKLINSIFKK